MATIQFAKEVRNKIIKNKLFFSLSLSLPKIQSAPYVMDVVVHTNPPIH